MSKLAIVCPGQGAQHAQMFDLALQSEHARTWLADFSDGLGYDIVEVARGGIGLFDNFHAQALVCGATVATWVALRERLPAPEAILGYSVGEMSAYGCADVWDAPTLAALTRKRAELMDRFAPEGAGLMALKGADSHAVVALCDAHRLSLAIVNGDDHVVLGGTRSDFAAALPDMDARGYWSKILDVAVPSHTPPMRLAAEAFALALADKSMHAMSAPVLMGISGTPASSATLAASLSQQIAQTVRWSDCMKTALEMGVAVVLEIGPGKSLSRMFTELDPALQARSAEDFRTLDGIVKWVASKV
ncbi:MAG: malonate decarboxylase subunit epsilon [Herbaspirillum sp.]|jgi:[acyl-carrier-protein] S-malonyltransferase|nr:malonate decarboxylase subunit epsilon [Herbaspirillum sp.]